MRDTYAMLCNAFLECLSTYDPTRAYASLDALPVAASTTPLPSLLFWKAETLRRMEKAA